MTRTNFRMGLFSASALLAMSIALSGESAMVVVLPDTQTYVEWKPSVLTNMFSWIVDQHSASNIIFVGHVGDVVNDYESNTNQWDFVQTQYARLASSNIPYSILPGNHDYAQGTRTSAMMNAFFPLSSFQLMETYGGAFSASQCDNTYHIIQTPELDWVIISLEFGPRSSVLDWANSVLASHSNKPAILLTHAYLNRYGERFVSGEERSAANGYGLGSAPPDVNDGSNIWEQLVYSNSNVRMVVCGHDGDTNVGARLKISTNRAGYAVSQVLCNYQYVNNPTYPGYMLLIDLSPVSADNTTSFRTYSPTRNEIYTNAESFGVLDMRGFILSVTNNIDAVSRYAWSSHTGWQNYRSTHGGVSVVTNGANGYLEGSVWTENVGWIKLGVGSGPYANTGTADWGVNMDASGNLSGCAWSSHFGWLNFHPTHGQVTVNTSTGRFDGHAWGENIGWIHFQNAVPVYNVRTTAFDSAPTRPQGTVFCIF